MRIDEIICSFPKELKELLEGCSYEENKVGCSNTMVYKVISKDGKDNRYLKVSSNEFENFNYEVDLLNWINGKLPVPRVLYHGYSGEYEFFLMSEICGKDSSVIDENTDKVKVAKALARGLRVIHSVPIKHCDFDQSLETKLRIAEFNVENDLVDEKDIRNSAPDATPEDILQTLKQNKPHSEDSVLTHGDYCLPNIILDKDYNISGFIDWGRGGVSDRHQDIGIGCRSIKRNLGEEMVPVFLEEYGLDKIDYSKIDYYILLDELF